jgi:hypothetical protein
MGTGHSKGSTPKLTRKDSKRFSFGKKKSGNQWNEELEQDKITEQEIIEKRRQTCLAVLKVSSLTVIDINITPLYGKCHFILLLSYNIKCFCMI